MMFLHYHFTYINLEDIHIPQARGPEPQYRSKMELNHAEVVLNAHFLQRRSKLLLLESGKPENNVRDGDKIMFPCPTPSRRAPNDLQKGGSNISWISQNTTQASVTRTCYLTDARK